jgi:hypothetical protein
MPPRSRKWLKLLEDFVAELRIKSKEVVSTDERGAKLEMWESQKRFLHEVGSGLDDDVHSFNALKSRQLGVTTISLAIDVFWLAVHPNLIGCLVTDTEKNREVNRSIVEGYIESFPDGYFGEQFKIDRSNRQMLQFSNGSRLDLLVAGTKKKSIAWGEGQGYALMHATEVASYGDVEGFKSLEEGLAQTNPDRLFIRESTAKGMNHWRARWYSGLDDLTERSFFIGWWSGDNNRIPRHDPRFAAYGLPTESGDEAKMIKEVNRLYRHRITPEQLAWLRWKRTKAGAEQGLLDQNQPSTAEEAFVQTGYSFFQVRVLGQDMKAIQDDPPLFQGYRYEVDGDFYHFKLNKLDPEVDDVDNVELKIWEEPVEGGQYVIGCDPAYGRNEHKDHHCLTVLRCFADCVVQVAEYVTRDVETKHFAWVIFHLCAAYRNSMCNVELGGPGRLVMAEFDHLRQLIGAEMNQAKTAARGWEDAAANARWYLYHKVDSPGAGYMANFETNWRTKMELLHGYRGVYVSREIAIRSMGLLREMSIVVDNDGEIGAPESSDENMKDDRVFAAALAVRAWSDWIRKSMLMQGLTYDVVMAMERGQEQSVQTTRLNSIVKNFLKTAEERANMEPEPEKWKVDQGLA